MRSTAVEIKGSPAEGLIGATLGFFIGFAAVSLFGPTVEYLKNAAALSPAMAGLLISIPNLSGSLLRIPFSAMVDTTGGRKPFIILLSLSILGLLGIFILLTRGAARLPGLFPVLLLFGVLGGCGIATFSVGISQTAYWFPLRSQGTALGIYAGAGNLAPGIFALLLSGLTLPLIGLAGSYLAWLVFLAGGTAAYLLFGRNAWYFQLRRQGLGSEQARLEARERYGQELFPKQRVLDSLKTSASVWQTWALVVIYFTTFGGFMALTGWLPKYWQSFHGIELAAAGALTAMYSVLASLTRISGGKVSDTLGGENTAGLSLCVALAGAVIMSLSSLLLLSVVGILMMAVGMGVGNAAVFKLVPQEIPQAIGGAAGWIGGLGAFGGFIIPNLLAAFLHTDTVGDPGYARGFLVFVALMLVSLGIVLVLKKRSAGRFETGGGHG
jgi:NNP family nitrate/nitrite transporter-like MFS transporter